MNFTVRILQKTADFGRVPPQFAFLSFKSVLQVLFLEGLSYSKTLTESIHSVGYFQSPEFSKIEVIKTAWLNLLDGVWQLRGWAAS